MFNSLKLNTGTFSKYKFQDKNYLTGLNRINIFIGQNSSGKSTLLRELFAAKEMEFLPSEYPISDINRCILEFRTITIQALQARGYSLGDHPLKILDAIELFDEKGTRINELNNFMDHLRSQGSVKASGGMIHLTDITDALQPHYNRFKDKLRELTKTSFTELQGSNIYIPVLRGLRNIDVDGNNKSNYSNNYLVRTKLDYFNGKAHIEDHIFTGLELFHDVRKMLLGDAKQRKLIREFEVFLSKSFFNEEEVTITPMDGKDVVFVKIGEEPDLPIYNLGDGVQALIILTFPLFLNQGKRMTFFFEEPDLYLHPGFQRIFINTLNKPQFSSFQYFLTTHSNHFLDMTLDFSDISVYSFRKIGDGKFEVHNAKYNDLNILKELGVRNSSVFLTNCTIWIEGISDRIYIRKYLELYHKTLMKEDHKYFEDIHYSYVEYGGNNITHWSFIENDETPPIEVTRLCGKLFLIVDKDGDSLIRKDGSDSKKAKRHQELADKLKDRYYRLECREIENLLSEKTLIRVVEHLEKENFNKVDTKNIKYSKYKDKAIGTFLHDNVTNRVARYRKSAENGAVWDKMEFAKIASDQINTFDELTREAQALTIKLYEFIKGNNQ